MPGSIQSIERAVAVLRLLAAAGRPLALAEVAAALGLAPATAHGIVATLRGTGFVEQDGRDSRYRIGPGLARLGRECRGMDRHDLRSAAMDWADSLAGGTGLAVVVGVPDGAQVRLVHHVFRPDGSAQRIRTGSALPLHATAPGKCLLATAPSAVPATGALVLDRYTGRTCTSAGTLEAHLDLARRRGYATDGGEYRIGVGGAAAPLRGGGGLVVGALGVTGPVEELFTASGALRSRIAEDLLGAAREVSAALPAP